MEPLLSPLPVHLATNCRAYKLQFTWCNREIAWQVCVLLAQARYRTAGSVPRGCQCASIASALRPTPGPPRP